jgi:hypothetical protein
MYIYLGDSMASKRCPLERLTDKATGLKACIDWCPVDKCVFETNAALSYKSLSTFLEQRQKLIRHNYRIRYHLRHGKIKSDQERVRGKGTGIT